MRTNPKGRMNERTPKDVCGEVNPESEQEVNPESEQRIIFLVFLFELLVAQCILVKNCAEHSGKKWRSALC